MKDFRIERRKVLDALLDKMEKAVQENVLIISAIEAKRYREEENDRGGTTRYV